MIRTFNDYGNNIMMQYKEFPSAKQLCSEVYLLKLAPFEALSNVSRL